MAPAVRTMYQRSRDAPGMISDLFNLLSILAFMFYGLSRPHIALAGVVWVDTVTPQTISTSFLLGKPLSMVMTLFFFMVIALNFNKISAPKQKLPLALLALFMVWITLSTLYAHHPLYAAFKYSVVIKILFLSAFIPFVINTRMKAECFLWVFQVSVGFYLHVAGFKALAGGGGYDVDIIQSTVENAGLTESSMLATMAALSVPIMVYLYRYSKLAANYRLVKFYLILTFVASVFCAIGTFARTGLVAYAFVVFAFFLISKKRIRLGFLAIVAVLMMLPLLPDGWTDRMSTIKSANQEVSALGRMVVWRWTLDYAADNPFLGGGFFSYLDNVGELQDYADEGESFARNERAKAYHNMYFEVLGEHGYVGLFIYLALVFTSIKRYWSLRNTPMDDEWFRYLSVMLLIALGTYFVGGMFIAIAYLPWLFYLLFLGVSLVNVVAPDYSRAKQ